MRILPSSLFGLFLMGIACSITSCANNDDEDQRVKDDALIQEYIAENSLNAIEGPEGLYVVIDNTGTGTSPNINSTVEVHYEGSLLNGTIFDSSYERGTPATFPLAGVIRGWQLGIPYFAEGGKGTLLVPSHLAYGGNPPFGSGIPANAVLVFNVEVLDVL